MRRFVVGQRKRRWTAAAGGPTRQRLLEAREVGLRDGPRQMLEWLAEHADPGDPETIRLMRAVVWNHRDSLPAELLARPFLDPIWCECTACGNTWLLSPVAGAADARLDRDGPLACTSCGRTFCPQCSRAARGPCTCGGRFEPLRAPNGRTRSDRAAAALALDDEAADEPWRSALGGDERLDEVALYFGANGTVPVGIDGSFPTAVVAPPAEYLGWAEVLLDEGLPYHANCQLERVADAVAGSGRALWLRARVELVTYRNGLRTERIGGRDQYFYNDPSDDHIVALLERAVADAPDLGRAWLDGALLFLDRPLGPDVQRALSWARRAHQLLGDDPAALLALGRALLLAGDHEHAIGVLARIPDDRPEAERAQRELVPARLGQRCMREPLDVAAHVELAMWHYRYGDVPYARSVFSKLRERDPSCGEGWWGVAMLALGGDGRIVARVERAHELASAAMRRHPDCPLAAEALGRIHDLAQHVAAELSFEPDEPLPFFRRALELDPGCDLAMLRIAEAHLDRRELEPALGLLERAAGLGTRLDSVYLLLAVIYEGTRRFERAQAAGEMARQLTTTVLDPYYEQRIRDMCGFRY